MCRGESHCSRVWAGRRQLGLKDKTVAKGTPCLTLTPTHISTQTWFSLWLPFRALSAANGSGTGFCLSASNVHRGEDACLHVGPSHRSAYGKGQWHLYLTQHCHHVTQWERGWRALRLEQQLGHIQTSLKPSLCYSQALFVPQAGLPHPRTCEMGITAGLRGARSQSNHEPYH